MRLSSLRASPLSMAGLLGALVVAAGCAAEPAGAPDSSDLVSEGTEFPEWTIPVPPDVPVHGLVAVDPEARTRDLPLGRDLVLMEAFGRPFYDPEDVAVDAGGNVYVLDSGNGRVVVFDPEGQPLRSFGRQGQGPGEFQSPGLIAVVGDRVIVHDGALDRWSVFGTDGRSIADHDVAERFAPGSVVGLDEGLLVIDERSARVLPGQSEPPQGRWTVGRYTLDAGLESTVFELEHPPGFAYWVTERGYGSVPLAVADPVGAISEAGVIYVTAGDQYQVHSLTPDGAHRWGLRVAYEPPAGHEQKQEVMELWRRRHPDLVEEDFVWPDTLAAVENLEVDSRGILYVFPHAGRSLRDSRETPEPVPVDVYSPDGVRRFAGWSRIEGWDAAFEDLVYRIETDPGTTERVVARYRFVDVAYRFE